MHARTVAGNDALGNLDAAADDGLVADGVRDRLGVDADDADAGILGPGVVHAVAQVADPGLEAARVVLAHDLAVRDDGGLARDGGPLARRVEEGDVDARVGVQVVRLAGLGVGVEEQV